jgi:hypothetical protein
MSHRRRVFAVERLESRLLMAADFGDAPAPYAVTLAESGARHEAVGPQLGAARDTEDEGVHSAAADADGADDDGVAFGAMRVGQVGAEISVTVVGAAAGARLDAWIDFNGDGVWGGPGEQIANNRAVTNGQNTLRVDVPADAKAGAVIARFRLSTAGNVGTEGPAADGEIEDYSVTIARPVAGLAQFQPPGQTVTTGADLAQSVYAADVDGDGDVDLISASSADDEVAWFENDGNGVFTTHVIDTMADGVRAVTAADLDGDGDTDILSGAETSGRISWHQNNGSEVFTTQTVTSMSNGVKNVLAVDVDGDGDLDVVSAQGNRIAWYENNGSQSFTQRLLPSAAVGVFGVAAADVDGDGDMDILWSSVTANEVGWYENNGIQTFTAHAITAQAMGVRNIATADVDGDGDLDILSASAADNKIAWYENDGEESFIVRTITTTAMMAWSVYPADVDGDGDVDVLAASANDDTVALFVNDGAESFTRRVVTTTTNGPRSVIAADIDGDGRLDVATASSADDKIAWFANQPDTSNADFDRDGDADGSDFLMWQRALGNPATPPGSGADGDGSGFVNADDLAVWRAKFGTVAPPPAIEELPAAALLPPEFGDNTFLAADQFAAPTVADSPSAAGNQSCEVAHRKRRDAAFTYLGREISGPGAVEEHVDAEPRRSSERIADFRDAPLDDLLPSRWLTNGRHFRRLFGQ